MIVSQDRSEVNARSVLLGPAEPVHDKRGEKASRGEDWMEKIELRRGSLAFTAMSESPAEPSDAEVVLCLHGFPDDARSFRHQGPALAGAGYRVISPYLRGYEPQSQPQDGDYSVQALAEDVLAWIDQLEQEKVHLVGHDWGAVIAYLAAALAPDRFHSLTAMAVPPGARMNEAMRQVPSQIRNSWYMGFFQLRGLADWRLERDDWALIRRLWRDWSPGFQLPDEEWSALRSTFAAPGVKKAMLAYYRQNVSPAILLGWKQPPAMKMTTVPVRTLAITGRLDGCMDTRLYDYAFSDEDFPAGYRVERIEGAGHFAHLEKPDVINGLLLDWMAAD